MNRYPKAVIDSQIGAAKKLCEDLVVRQKKFDWIERNWKRIKSAARGYPKGKSGIDASFELLFFFVDIGAHGQNIFSESLMGPMPPTNKRGLKAVAKKFVWNPTENCVNAEFVSLLAERMALTSAGPIDSVDAMLVGNWADTFCQPKPVALCICSNRAITDWLNNMLGGTSHTATEIMKRRQRLGLKPWRIVYRNFRVKKQGGHDYIGFE